MDGELTWAIETDLNDAQTILYRRLSAGLYQAKDGEYYHIHGSLEASKTLEMIGLPSHNPDVTDYDACIKVIEGAVKKYTVLELEEMTKVNLQAGAPVYTHEEFLATPHGKTMNELPPFTVKAFETTTPKAPFGGVSSEPKARQVLEGVRVLELCRIIAGPTIGRSLAALGATVLKVTSPQLPDVPFFQVDGNLGKHTTSLHLKGNDKDRQVFKELLESADVIIDGYSPGSLDRLGYGPKQLKKVAERRGKGFVYVAEDCFGGTDDIGDNNAEWASRRGWQQIADCVTGVAWEQGKFMDKDEPVIPPFPMSDYGTGALGSLAALTGLYRRNTEGGSWVCRTSLVQYDLFLLSLGLHTPEVQVQLREVHSPEFFELRHYDSVDVVGKRALESTNRAHGDPFKDELMQTTWSPEFGNQGSGGAVVTFPREAVTIESLDIGHVRPTRRNGFDQPSWEGWERDEDLLQGKDKSDPVEKLMVLD